jgi:deazaflavin-dependent oxidoreductase (nitroreductase family)
VPVVKPVPRWLRATNRAALALSRLGLTMGPVCVLTVPGRRTGKPCSAPVSPLTAGGGRYVVSALPDSDWARNVRAAGHAQLSRGRRREPVTLTEVTDRTLKEQVMRAYPREVPKGAPMFARAGITTSPDPDAFAAAAGHVAVFQVRPAPPARRNEDAP